MIETMSRVRNVTRHLFQVRGCEPSVEETAEAAGLSVDETSWCAADEPAATLPGPADRRSRRQLLWRIPGRSPEDDPLYEMNQDLLKARIADVLGALNYREREIIRLRYGWPTVMPTPWRKWAGYSP